MSGLGSSSSVSGVLFSPIDFSALAACVGLHAEVLGRRLTAQPSPRLNDFKVTELKEILKWIKANPNWQTNPYLYHRSTASNSTGKKQVLIDHLKLLLHAQANPSAVPPPPASIDPNTQNGMAHQNNSPMAMQAQYRQQQQQAQAAAARFQANDPYRYPAGGRPMQAPPQSQYPSGYGAPQQYPTQPQFAYTNGTRDYSQFATGQQRGYVQQQTQAGSNGYAHVYHQQAGYPQQQQQQQQQATNQPPQHQPQQVSNPALQHAARQSEIAQLTSAPGMQLHLSPYEQVVQALARNLLNATSHTPNQSTGAAGGAYHTTLTFNIAQAYMSRIKRASRPVPAGQESQVLEVHLRLFSGQTLEHFPWDKKFRVLVNGHEVVIPEPKKLSKSKKKGLELVRGLDISEYVQSSNTVEVSVYRHSYTVELFRGLVLADLVRIRDTSELMDQFRKTVKDEESKMQAIALERSCVICHSKKDPLRCSRCKNEWYCLAEDHQLLTSDGFMTLDRVESAMNAGRALQFATLNEGGYMEYQSPTRLIVHPPHEQTMIDVTQCDEKARWSSASDLYGRSSVGPLRFVDRVSLLVTPDHDMWLSAHKEANFQKHKAAHMHSNSELIQCRLQVAAPRGVLQKGALDLASIFALGSNPANQQIGEFLERYGAASHAHQRFAPWVWLLQKDEIQHVLNGLVRANGEESSDACTIFTTDSTFRDDILHLCLRAGHAAMFLAAGDSSSADPSWLVTYSLHTVEPVVDSARDVTKVSTYSGRTWCVQVPNGLLFARRAHLNEVGVATRASLTTIVGNCGSDHQRQHWSIHREVCAMPTPEQDAAREATEKRAAQLAMLGKNGRTKLIIPAKLKNEVDGDDDGVEEVDALVSLRCPLSLERCEYPARGRHCDHLPCFNLETYLMFSQQSGVWQCPICYRGLPWEEIEVNLQMAAILRETDAEIAQIRVHPDGEYDPIRAIPDGETGDGREPGRKRKQPSASPTPAPAQPTKLQAIGSTTPDLTTAIATGADAGATPGPLPLQVSGALQIPASAVGSDTPSPIGNAAAPPPAPSPTVAAAGTADEPIELD